ncbi:MAG: MBL fold metallo-hydrolase [Nitrososphaeraceae archaeon]
MLNTQSSAAAKKLSQDQLLLRINGVLPDIATLGNVEKSERAAEVKQLGTSTNTSCSLFATASETNQIFHILVDIGQGIVKSIEKGIFNLGFASSSILPDALLVTHSHDDHIIELPLLADKTSKSKNLNIYCTSQCRDQILSKYPQLSSKINNKELVFSIVQPDQTFQVGPFSVIPLLADHGDNSPAGSVIYIVKLTNRKVIIGWDFLSLPNVNEDLLWNPDLAILGTQSYNPHPQTGMISVSEAFELVRRWNAKECYIVHYRGLIDFEEATNQWFRGPVKAMTVDELQKVIDSHLQIIGKEGKFRMTVAKEGMVWDSKRLETKQEEEEKLQESSPQNASTSPQFVEIEGLQNYIFRMENEHKVDKLKIMIEDRINRYNLEFDKPRKVVNAGDNNKAVLVAQAVKGMLAKGPDLRMEITPKTENEYAISVRASKGKKNLFSDDILISSADAQRLKRYINENFIPSPQDAN